MSKMLKVAMPFVTIFFLSACGGGGESTTNSNKNDKQDPPPTLSSTHQVSNKSDASKFLNRSTFGPTTDSINNLISKGTYEKWLTDQFNMPATLHAPKVNALAKKMCANITNDGDVVTDSWEFVFPRHQIWWETALNGDDQLRQRVAFALSEILVISDSDGLGLSGFQYAVTSYYDVLIKHAFGNYRDLLEEVTLHPAMGDFLSMTRNQKANAEEGVRPDENYAREVLQLFTIGVHELNLDGSEKLDGSGNTIPTYNQKTIEEFAKVFTGWNYSDIDWHDYFGNADHSLPLVAVEKYHDTSTKKLLGDKISPSGQSAKDDLIFALDNIFKHPNIAPFISKQLIQRLVTSNPSPAYVERVATVFNDNGENIKGDLAAVVAAILLDDEALATNKPDSFGKLREPLLRMSHLWRAFDMQNSLKVGHYWEPEKTCGQGNYPYLIFWDSITNFGKHTAQSPLGAKSVFNFFRPDFSPNGVLNDQGLVAPEFQTINENTLTSNTNLLHYMVTFFSDSKVSTPKLEAHSKLNLSNETTLAKDTDKLLNHLSLTLLNNEMSDSLRGILKEHLELKDGYIYADNANLEKAKEAIMLIISSPEYLIQR
ncbi:MAG: DUF1800 family protein [Methylophagaceae bacterium]